MKRCDKWFIYAFIYRRWSLYMQRPMKCSFFFSKVPSTIGPWFILGFQNISCGSGPVLIDLLCVSDLATSSDCPGTQIARGILSLHMARTTRNHTSSAHVRYVRNLRKSKSFQIYEHDSKCQRGLGKVFKTLDKTWVTQKGCQQVQAQRPQWHLKFLGLFWVDGFRMTVQALDWLWQ